MPHAIRTIAISAAFFPLAGLLLGTAALSNYGRVPLFEQLAAQSEGLRSYVVPVKANVTLYKIFPLHFALSGTMQYTQSSGPTLTMARIPEHQRHVFARLATPRSWPRDYDFRVTGTNTVAGRAHYTISGVPKAANDDVSHFVADVSDDPKPSLKVTWFLRGGGTVAMQIDTTMNGPYALPSRELTDIRIPGYRVHADVKYGSYVLSVANAHTNKS